MKPWTGFKLFLYSIFHYTPVEVYACVALAENKTVYGIINLMYGKKWNREQVYFYNQYFTMHPLKFMRGLHWLKKKTVHGIINLMFGKKWNGEQVYNCTQ